MSTTASIVPLRRTSRVAAVGELIRERSLLPTSPQRTLTAAYFDKPDAETQRVRARLRGLKLLTGLLYVLLIGATAAWVFLGWPSSDQAELRAEASAVPGALEGRTLILVSNTGDGPWTDVEIVLDEQFVFTARSLAPGEQLNLPVDDFTYTYAIPRNWNTGIWAALSNEQQPALREDRSVSPQTIYIRTAEGKATLSLQ